MKKTYRYIIMLAMAVACANFGYVSAQETYISPAFGIGAGGLRVSNKCPYNYHNGVSTLFGFDLSHYFKGGHGFQIGLNAGHSGGYVYEITKTFIGSGTQPFTNAQGTTGSQQVQYTMDPGRFNEQYDFWNLGIPVTYTYKISFFYTSVGVEFIVPLSLKAKTEASDVNLYLGPEIPELGVTLNDPLSMGTIDDISTSTTMYSRSAATNHVTPSFVCFLWEAGLWLPLVDNKDLVLSFFLDYSPKKIDVATDHAFIEVTPTSTETYSLMHTDAITSLRYLNLGLKLKLALGVGKK